jgi:hypothetical protein
MMVQVMLLVIVPIFLALQKQHVKQRLVIRDLRLGMLVIVPHLLALQERHARQQQLDVSS